METLKFKTNIKCGGCEAAVTPFMDKVAGKGNWIVDTSVPEKVLSVTNDDATASAVIAALKEAGYIGEQIS